MGISVNFEWTLSSDQAVLAEVIRRSEIQGHRLGRTGLQKIPYFLMRRGVPLGYSYDLHHFGPFCQEILWDAEMLELVGAISDDRGGYRGGSRYSTGDQFKEKIAEHQPFLDEHSKVIEEVVALLAPLGARLLEVVATIDYFYRYESAADGHAPFKQAVIKRFLQAKPQYLKRTSMVENLYDQMAKIGMIEA